MRFKALIMDEKQIKRTIIRMSHEIIEHNRGVEGIALVGISRRGLVIANDIAKVIHTVEGEKISVGSLEITHNPRHDAESSEKPDGKQIVKALALPFSAEDANIILVDDVLFTGRTAITAISALTSAAAPKSVQFAALIVRDKNEVPVYANYTGKKLPYVSDELVSVSVREIDGKSSVETYSIG
jgi:pyrimidine operon attenuation protein/uracil phosphoribosyltransferase